MKLLKAYLSRQLRHPTGYGGRLILRLINQENGGMNAIAINVLDAQPGQQILEIGCGGGDLINRLLKTEQLPQITAIDASQTAVDMVCHKFKEAMATHRLVVHQAKAEAMPFADNGFDAIVTVNTLYFWPDVPTVINECQRCLKPGGQLVITYNSKAFLEEQQATQFGFRAYEVSDVETYLKRGGFDTIETTSSESMSNGTFFCTHGIVTNA